MRHPPANLLAFLLISSLSAGCTLLPSGPCQPHQASPSGAYFAFEIGSSRSDIALHLNATGWKLDSPEDETIYGDKAWNETLYIHGHFFATPKVGGNLLGPSVLTPGEAEQIIGPPAEDVMDGLAQFLRIPPTTIRYDGGVTHCGVA
jgi:hypothetical protein